MRMTVNDLMTWYNGETWSSDEQTLNCVTVNKVHTQHGGNWLWYLKSKRFKVINPSCKKVANQYEITFELDGYRFEMDACSPILHEEEGVVL